MHSLHKVHKIKAYRADYVCLSVFAKFNSRTTETWYGHYATGGYPKISLFNFLYSVIPTWWMHELVRWE
jgi:hypothetical protein